MTGVYEVSTTKRRPPRFLRVALIAAVFGVMGGCGGGGHHYASSYNELLVVTDQLSVKTYAVSGGSASLLGSAMVPGIPGTYSRAGNLVTVTMPKHNIQDGYWVTLDFSAGIGGTATDGTYVVSVVDPDTFTITDTASGAITGGSVLRTPAASLNATYTQTGTTVTIDLPAHGLNTSDTVTLDYTSGTAVDDNTEVATVVDADHFTVEADAADTTSGNVTVVVGDNYTIFGVAMHPSGKWLYVTSSFDCYNGSPYCWGGDLISKFAINWDTGGLQYQESYRTSDDAISVTPVTEPEPVSLRFSADGTRLVHQDDDLDGLWLWDVDPSTGALSLLASSARSTTRLHGIVFSSDQTRVYNGTNVFTLGPSAIDRTTTGTGGQGNAIVGSTMYTIIGGRSPMLETYSLADPDAPAMIASTAVTPNSAVDLALLGGGSLVVTSGWGGLKTYAYDGMALTDAMGAGDTELRDGGLPFPPQGDLSRVYRSISLDAAQTLAACAYFTHDPNAGNGGLPPSGFVLVNVAADGSLSLANDYPTGTYARVAKFLEKP